MAAARETMAALVALGVYRARILPRVRRELERWREIAAAIPDPTLREQALAAIDEKGANVEATAVFATVAPRRRRSPALRAMVALQVAVDYLDTLGEQSCEEPLKNGLQLHRALEAAVTPDAPPQDWYRFHPRREDGGYLDRLVAACQESAGSLPASAAVLPLAGRAARRCGEGQSHTHAAELERHGEDGARELAAWANGLGAPAIYRWWETAAGASSSVATHALLAAAADPRTSAPEAALVDAAYFPPVGALTVLLDDLIDREIDAAAGGHSYLAYYGGGEETARRLELIIGLARTAIVPLRRRHRHAAILSGVLGFYLGAAGSELPDARGSRDRLLASAGPSARLIAASLRQRRR